MFQSQFIDEEIERIAINSKHQSAASASSSTASTGSSSSSNSPNVNATNIISAANSSIGSNMSSSSNQSTPSNNQSSMLSHNNSISASSPNSSPLNTSTLGSSQNSQLTLENAKLCALLAIAVKTFVRLWLVVDESTTHLIGNFCLNSNVENLFFIGSQLVATSSIGKIGIKTHFFTF